MFLLHPTTQYQGTGSSHELAALLLTEVIQYSLYVVAQPVYWLALDAESAFDRCLRQVLTSDLYKNSSDYYKLYNNEQLKSAQTSGLGVDIGSDVISAIGQADDVILAASSLYTVCSSLSH